jgi:hypothetical protein
MMAYRVADTQIWNVTGSGPTVAEAFAAEGIYFTKAEKDRTRNYAEIVSRLSGEGTPTPQGYNTDRPMLFISTACQHTWRTLPSLVLDPIQPDKGPSEKNAEDHAYDALAYLCRSRPWVQEQHEWEEMNMDEEDRIIEKPPYSYVESGRVH